ncbi:OLC1v1020067C1 [Oldenlandia corymbosa var. corymbosa]|uniref:OLC1v1020067C1 n=1 Tax=Oldenlandia corymbosa var. corymbosa TaxID=529605 RepID=A0AAV1EFN1_OLDCO|nr:OLC1v1020067C1 [Oldenlandia corymbosa var. corymbosa]
MRDFPSCFSENGVQVADASGKSLGISRSSPQNLVTCIHQCKLLGRTCHVTIVWSRNLMGHCLSVEIDDLFHRCLCKVDVRPSLFSKRKGSKCFEVYSSRIDLYWDLSAATFGSGPEPLEGYYIAVVCRGEIVLFVGDLKKEALKKTNAIPSNSSPFFVSKREHLFGKRVYGTKAQFWDNGQIHELKIECDTHDIDDPSLMIHIDRKPVMQVNHIHWKFRGNFTILVDGLPVEVLWDVYNWFFGSAGYGNAVFVFWSCQSAEKLWRSPNWDDEYYVHSLLSSAGYGESKKQTGPDFSLVLYAWKNE